MKNNEKKNEHKSFAENNYIPGILIDKSFENLKAECENCFGLCCVALYFSASEGFPADKEPGKPCQNLLTDFRCKIHEDLRKKGLKGCTAFDCFGAGQKVAKVTFEGNDWRKNAESANKMYDAFLIMRQLHELLWYLSEALILKSTQTIHGDIKSMLDETEKITNLDLNKLIVVDVAAHREKVNYLLVKTSEIVRNEALSRINANMANHKSFAKKSDLLGADRRKKDLVGADFRGACLIAANLSGTDLSGADVIGADFRDADLCGANLAESLFITQAQLNVARGDTNTKLPATLERPEHWIDKEF